MNQVIYPQGISQKCAVWRFACCQCIAAAWSVIRELVVSCGWLYEHGVLVYVLTESWHWVPSRSATRGQFIKSKMFHVTNSRAFQQLYDLPLPTLPRHPYIDDLLSFVHGPVNNIIPWIPLFREFQPVPQPIVIPVTYCGDQASMLTDDLNNCPDFKFFRLSLCLYQNPMLLGYASQSPRFTNNFPVTPGRAGIFTECSCPGVHQGLIFAACSSSWIIWNNCGPYPLRYSWCCDQCRVLLL